MLSHNNDIILTVKKCPFMWFDTCLSLVILGHNSLSLSHTELTFSNKYHKRRELMNRLFKLHTQYVSHVSYNVYL